MRAASNKTTIANINSNTHHTHHARHTHTTGKYTFTHVSVHTYIEIFIDTCVCVCVWGNVQATGQFSRKQDRLRQVGAGRDGTEGDGTVQRQHRTEQNGTVLDRRQVMAAACWRNEERPKLTGTQRRNHEFHFKL